MGKKRGQKGEKNQAEPPGHSAEKYLAAMDTDEFLQNGLEVSSDEDSTSEVATGSVQAKSDDSEEEAMPRGGKSAVSKHKQSLAKLKEQDPKFYAFLQKEDQSLLDFDDSSGEDEDDDEDDDDEADEDQEGRIHKLPEKLEVASDDSLGEDSDEEETKDKVKEKKGPSVKEKKGPSVKVTLVTLKMISSWSKNLQAEGSLVVMQQAVTAFKAAVRETGSEKGAEDCPYKVEGSTVFNAVVRLCLTDLLPAIRRFLKLPQQKDPNKPVLPSTSPRWKRVRVIVKSYLTDLLQMTAQIGEPTILNVLLKHIHQLAAFYVGLPKLARHLLKRAVVVWSTGEETSRVLAFLIISRLTHYMKERLLESTLKQMYLAYVRNCKFTSPTTLPLINFMQRSLVEMFALDAQLTYQYAFVYIRQLAIHLRNAITVKKKENCQAVYNWQYVHSLQLWARLLAELHDTCETLQPLVYPLTQTIIGTIKLVPTARYYPLRFQCVRSLNLLSEATSTYIPVLPFLLEVFELTDFNKKHKSLSFKPLNFAVILKLSKAQLQEKAFRDGTIDQLYELLLDQFHIHAHCAGFPELALPALVQLKQFVKQCKVSNYTKQIKQILEKVEATSKVITQRRKTASFNLADANGVLAWERRSKQEGTPLSTYYATWRKLRDRELQHEIAGKERISTDDLPQIVRRREPKTASTEERKEFAELFDTDSEDEGEDDETRFLLKNERPNKKQKTQRHDDDDSDVGNYSDFDSDELEELAQSADEDSEEEDEDEEEEEESEDDDEEEEKPRPRAVPSTADDDDDDDPDDVVEDFRLSDDD